jgi:hypothetical protein
MIPRASILAANRGFSMTRAAGTSAEDLSQKLHRRPEWFETRPGCAGALLTMTEAENGIEEVRHPESVILRACEPLAQLHETGELRCRRGGSPVSCHRGGRG